jgi:hypothetical protein
MFKSKEELRMKNEETFRRLRRILSGSVFCLLPAAF